VVDARKVGRYAVFIVVYVAAAKLGFRAAFVAEQVSPVWPPTGLALWATLYFGPRVWPAIFLGAAIANVTTHVPILPASVIAAGNTLEAVVGAWLIRRYGDRDRSFDSLRQVVVFILGAAIISTSLAATVGVLTLCIAHLQSWSRFGALWSIWWLGDATGAMLVAPLLLTIPVWSRLTMEGRKIGELAAIEVTAIVLSVLVFAVWSNGVVGHHRLEYLVFPLVMWAGWRFAHPGAAVVSASVSLIAVLGTLQRMGPFSDPMTSPHESITLLQIFTGVIAASGLVFGAAIADRNHAEQLRNADHLLTAILAQEQDLKNAARRILQTVAETLDWDVGLLWRVDDGGGRLELVDSWSRSDRTQPFVEQSRQSRFPAGIGLPGRVWASGEAVWIRDFAVDPNLPRAPSAAQSDLHSGFAFPIMAGTKFLGVTEFFTHQPRALDTSRLTMMAAVGSQIGQFIELRFTQQQATEKEALASDLLERERAARLEAERANRAKDQFLATVSHELRTPLTAILGWSSMLQRGEFDADRAPQIYSRIFRNAQAQAQIVNDLLDVSRIVTGQLRLEWQRTDVCEVARLSVETMRPTALAKGIAFDAEIPDEECAVILGDPARLQQVIWNLLSNAIKFTPSGGRVSLSVRTADHMAVIDVTDTGIGIAPEFLPRLFERFWQADSTSTRVHGGLGLGLALARHIVEIHGGEVKGFSQGEGKGSTFVIQLPLRSDALPAD